MEISALSGKTLTRVAVSESNDEIYLTDTDGVMKMVGHLNKPQGLVGFKPAPIGYPVFELGDRYIIVLETLDGKQSAEVPYFKEDFKYAIDFI